MQALNELASWNMFQLSKDTVMQLIHLDGGEIVDLPEVVAVFGTFEIPLPIG